MAIHSSNRPLARACWFVSAAAFSGYLALATLAHFVGPMGSPVHQPLSELALGPTGHWMAIAIGLRGVGGMTLALLVSMVLPGNLRSRGLAVLLFLWGVSCLASGIFPMDVSSDVPTIAGRIHRISAPLSWILIALAVIQLMGVLSVEDRTLLETRFVRGMGMATLATCVALLAVVAAHRGVGPYFGAVQRAFHVAFMAWLFGILAKIRTSPAEHGR